jgi:hypothetical protein
MKVGLIVYSLSGHSLQSARSLAATLTAAGHEASLARKEIVGPAIVKNAKAAALKTAPSVAPYDALVLCSPHPDSLQTPVNCQLLSQPNSRPSRSTVSTNRSKSSRRLR